MHTILAIDPGEKNSGFAVFKFEAGALFLANYGKYKFPHKVKSYPWFDVAEWHRGQCSRLMDKYKPDLIVVEYPALASHQVFSKGALHYAYMLRALYEKLDWVHQPIQSWKFFISGRGNARPVEYRDAVNKKFNLSVSNYDEAAAIGIGFCGASFWLAYKGRITLNDKETTFFFKRKNAILHKRGLFWQFQDLVWREHPKYSGYQLSDSGLCFSNKSNKYLSSQKDSKGYNDNDKSNNSISNLMSVTPQQNVIFAQQGGSMKQVLSAIKVKAVIKALAEGKSCQYISSVVDLPKTYVSFINQLHKLEILR